MSVDDLVQGSSLTPPKPPQFIRWNAPPPGSTKINFDGSLQNLSAAGGFIMRDWRGAVVMIGTSNYGSTSIMVAEGRALKDGIQAASAAGYNRLHIEGDNLTVIEALQGKTSIPWQLTNIIQDIHVMLSQVEQVVVNHIYRESNMAADSLSKYGHSILGQFKATKCRIPELRSILRDDMLGRTFVRRDA